VRPQKVILWSSGSLSPPLPYLLPPPPFLFNFCLLQGDVVLEALDQLLQQRPFAAAREVEAVVRLLQAHPPGRRGLRGAAPHQPRAGARLPGEGPASPAVL